MIYYHVITVPFPREIGLKNKNKFCEIKKDFVFPFTPSPLTKPLKVKKKSCEIKELSEKKDGMESGY